MTLGRLVFGFISVVFGLTLTSSAYAQTCASDADCRKGTACQQVAVPPISVPPSATCPKDQPCTEPAPAPVPIPADTVSSTCQPVACQSDADCGQDMLCHTETFATCSGGSARACPANEPCDLPAPTPTTCTETKISSCAYRWQLPCNADADCGADFVCMPSVTGTCSGSGGTVVGGGTTPAGGETTPAVATTPPTPPDRVDPGTTCTTTTSFPGYCQPRATTCDTTSDCPASWTCVETPAPVGRDTPVSDSSGDGTPPPVATTAAKFCQPPGGFAVGGVKVTDSSQGVGSPSSGALPPTAGETSGRASTSNTGCTIGADGSGSDLGAAGALGLCLLAIAIARPRSRKLGS